MAFKSIDFTSESLFVQSENLAKKKMANVAGDWQLALLPLSRIGQHCRIAIGRILLLREFAYIWLSSMHLVKLPSQDEGKE